MKKLTALLIALLILPSCATTSIFKEKIDLNQLLKAKNKIDATDNAARQLLLKNDLVNKILVLNRIKVKDIIASTNVDYDFCVISDIDSPEGKIEVYIYTKNIRALSRLNKGESVISVEGEFSRFFTMLDDYYVKIDITNSRIKVDKPSIADTE